MNKLRRGLGGLTLVLALVTGTAWAASPAKVLILPPVLHGSADMAFLRQGVVDMLTTRLAKPGEVVVLPLIDDDTKTAFDQAGALARGRERGAGYVIFGSLTLLGSGISTDLRMLQSTDGELALAYSQSGSDQAALISHMDQFTAQVNQQVFGRSSPKSVTAPPQPRPAVPVPAPDTIHQHPEKLLGRPLSGEERPEDGASPAGSGFVVAGDTGAMRGPRIKAQVQGVAVGDLTGDGRLESVYVGRHSVWIYRFVNGRFAKMAHIKGTGNYVGVDTIDLDGDGRDEIFVTSVDDSDGRPISFVLVYNGRSFERRADNLGFYFRAVNLPQRGRILLGQRNGVDTFFVPGIFEIAYQGGEYQRAARWKVPSNINLYGMGKGVFSAGDSGQLVAFTKSRYLELLSPNGKNIWRSGEHFGGTVALLQNRESEELAETLLYVPARIEVLDLDKDGVDEVVVMRNQEITGSVLSRTRILKKGRIEVLKADMFGLTPYWQTRYISKFVGDFALADLDGDGQKEIVAAVVQKTGTSLKSGQSQIYIFKLGAGAASNQDG